MKRLIAPFLAAGLILSTATAAQAVDFKVKGLSQHRISWADRNSVSYTHLTLPTSNEV